MSEVSSQLLISLRKERLGFKRYGINNKTPANWQRCPTFMKEFLTGASANKDCVRLAQSFKTKMSLAEDDF